MCYPLRLFFTSASTRALALASAFFAFDSSPFRYASQAGLPITNWVRPNLCVLIALLVASSLRTVNAQSAIQDGGDFVHFAQSDLYGESCPDAPRTSLPRACFQTRTSRVRNSM